MVKLMKRAISTLAGCLCVAVALSLACDGQDIGFAAASVKQAPGVGRPTVREDAARVAYTYAGMSTLIRKAYAVQGYQVVGPSWLNSEFYDIQATLPEGATVAQIPEMLRELLKDRFHASVHWEDRETSGYALELAGGARRPKECRDDDCPRDGLMFRMGGDSFYRLQARTSGKLAGYLFGLLKEPVVDETGLTGTYALELNTHALEAPNDGAGVASSLTIEGRTIDIPGTTPLVFDALKELGLRVVHRKLTIKSLVFDRLDRVPTEN